VSLYSNLIAEDLHFDQATARVVEVVIRGNVPTLDHLTRTELAALARDAFGEAIELAALGLLESLCQGECEVPTFFRAHRPQYVYCTCGGKPGQHTAACAITLHPMSRETSSV
jgi:hypothetical protein